MWQYRIGSRSPSERFIELIFEAEATPGGITEVALPAWRPGRYELGNFAKNIRHFSVTDEKGVALNHEKINSHNWIIHSGEATGIRIRYSYYANQPDAGACFTDDELLYVNPVHCCLYIPGMLNTPCKLFLDIPAQWQVATAMKKDDAGFFSTADFHTLADSPFIASPHLQHQDYVCEGKRFHIWIEGISTPDWLKIIHDFKAFTEVQLKMMGNFPVDEYHFLILLLPYRFYHGVEHTASTVLALGPGYQLMHPSLYNNLIGVASHELFHAWNVKTLRPADFINYDYSRENYSRLGWVYEGFTTYYGDLFLSRSNFFNSHHYLEEISIRLQKHIDNYGRYNLSVADSSFDTWLDGYVAGTPHRKTSIYDEGSLIALMLDLYIRRSSSNKYSLDTLFVQLYKDFSHGNGYHENDIRALAETYSDKDVVKIFDDFIHTPADFRNYLQELFDYCGCYISSRHSWYTHERYFGFKTLADGTIHKIIMIAPGSPAALAGLSKDDEIIAVNGIKAETDLSAQVDYYLNNTDSVQLDLFSSRRHKTVQLIKNGEEYYPVVHVLLQEERSEIQRANFKLWTGHS